MSPMKCLRANPVPPLSCSAVPLLGLGALLLCLWHPQAALPPDTGSETMIFLQDPDPRLDRSLALCLRQQGKEVARCRRLARPADLTRAVAGYNLIARECTPAVFQATGLPPTLVR